MSQTERFLPIFLPISGVPTEAELLNTVDLVCRRLCHKFKFGYNDIEDIRQEGYIFALRALRAGKFKKERASLGAFLYVHIHNQLYNLKRNKYARPTPPCLRCPLNAYRKEDDACLAYSNKTDCKLYSNWLLRNEAKRSLANAGGDSPHTPQTEGSPQLDIVDFLDFIEPFIPDEFKLTWDLARRGARYNRNNFTNLIAWVQAFIEENSIEF